MMKKIVALFLVVLCVSCVFAQKMAKPRPRAKAPVAQNASWIVDYFGDELTNAKGEKVNPSSLKGKIVGVYFSAHWCPPCRQFTPKLVKFRDDMVKKGEKFEVVFVSSDKDEGAMNGYMKETKMHWLALSFNSPKKESLATKYGVRGIPTLIILAPDGSTITTTGRADVTKNPNTALKSWAQKVGKGKRLSHKAE